MKTLPIKYLLVLSFIISSISARLSAQCNTEVNRSPVPGGTYYSTSGAVLNSVGKINSGSLEPVVFRSNEAVVLAPGFHAEAVTGLHFSAQSYPLKLKVVSFEDNDYPDVAPQKYTYNFSEPVDSDLLTTSGAGYQPSMSNRYFLSVFGPRFLEDRFDFHQGEDIVDGDNPATAGTEEVYCMCEGEVVQVGTTPDDGDWVIVKCNESFAGSVDWGNIYLAYRHLHSISGPTSGPISRNQQIGTIGETSGGNTLFHFSVLRKFCDEDHDKYFRGQFYNVHPMRAFNPVAFPHLLDTLDGAEVFLLDYDVDEAVFRVGIPYNQANIRAISVSLTDGSYQKIYDFEQISRESTGEELLRDTTEYVKGLSIYPYPFNRGQSVYDRTYTHTFPAEYPINEFPISDKGIFSTPAYVLDLKVEGLPIGYCVESLQLSLIDIWGNGVKTEGNRIPQISLSFNPSNPTDINSRYVADNDLFFETGETIELLASAFDVDGSVNEVELLVNGATIDTDFAAPFGFNVSASSPVFTEDAWNEIIAKAIDNKAESATSDTLRVYVSGNHLITRRLTQNAGDAEEKIEDGSVNVTESFDLDLCYDGANDKQYIGLWFNNIQIEKNVVIERAYLQFAAKEAEGGFLDIDIYGEAADNPSAFDNTTHNLKGRIPDLAYPDSPPKVVWSPGNWTAGASGLAERSVDISTIVQKTVMRNGWAPGNSMAFIMEADNDMVRRRAYSYHGCKPEKRKMTRLIVEYASTPAPLRGEENEESLVDTKEVSLIQTLNDNRFNLHVYPNPVRGEMVNLKFQRLKDIRNATIGLYNALGQFQREEVASFEDGYLHQIDFSRLPRGIYFLKVEAGSQVLTRKLVIE